MKIIIWTVHGFEVRKKVRNCGMSKCLIVVSILMVFIIFHIIFISVTEHIETYFAFDSHTLNFILKLVFASRMIFAFSMSRLHMCPGRPLFCTLWGFHSSIILNYSILFQGVTTFCENLRFVIMTFTVQFALSLNSAVNINAVTGVYKQKFDE